MDEMEGHALKMYSAPFQIENLTTKVTSESRELHVSLSAVFHKQSIHCRLYTKHIQLKMSDSLRVCSVVSVVTGHKQEYNPGAIWQGI